MNTKTINRMIKLSVLFLTISQIGCALNIARTNARIEDGLHGGIGFAATSTVGGVEVSGPPPSKKENKTAGFAQGDLGYGVGNDDGFGFDINGKLGFGSLAALDLYLQAPRVGNFYYGLGADVGFQNDLYLIGSYYTSKNTFLSLTGRAGRDIMDITNRDWFYSPQLSFGFDRDGGLEQISIFAGYTYFAGRGQDVTLRFTTDVPRESANHFVYAGIDLTF